MTDAESKELKIKEKQEVSSPAEQTRQGLVFTPDVDIFESETDITLLADLPGVTADKLTIDLRDNTLTLTGETDTVVAQDEEAVLMEYQTGNFYRQFSLSEMIDQSRIEAELKDGVLRLRLPKVEKVQPRKISVKSG